MCVLCVRTLHSKKGHPECGFRSLYWEGGACLPAPGAGIGVGSWGRASLEKDQVWEGGVVTGQGLGSGTPTVGAAEAAGPTATAEGHGEGDHWVHATRAAREPDGGKPQLVVGAHRLRHGWQEGRQHSHLEARTGQESMGRCSRPSPLPVSLLPPTTLGSRVPTTLSSPTCPTLNSSSPPPAQARGGAGHTSTLLPRALGGPGPVGSP